MIQTDISRVDLSKSTVGESCMNIIIENVLVAVVSVSSSNDESYDCVAVAMVLIVIDAAD